MASVKYRKGLGNIYTLRQKYRPIFYAITTLLVLALLGVCSFEYWDEQELAYGGNQPVTAPTGQVTITIKVASRVLEVYNDGKLYKRYRVAVGKHKSPTPIGEWVVVYKDYSDKDIFGTRWIGLNVPWGSYGIHGTNRPWSIGQFASQGCIRMRKKDVEELFEWVPIGTLVKIQGRKEKVQRILRHQTAGQDVVMLQLKLKELGYFNGRADGLFGLATQDAVKAYQQAKGLEPTGVVTKKLCNLLGI